MLCVVAEGLSGVCRVVLGVFLLLVFEVAFAAQGLVFVSLAQEYAAVAVDKSVGVVGDVAALDADGVHLGYVVGDGEQGGHRAEGDAAEVHVQPGYDDACTVVGKLAAYFYDAVVEELGFVYSYDIDVACHEQYAVGVVYRCRVYGVAVVRYDVFF